MVRDEILAGPVNQDEHLQLACYYIKCQGSDAQHSHWKTVQLGKFTFMLPRTRGLLDRAIF